MIDPMAHWPRKPRMGALLRRNTRRLVLRGRPWRRYAAIALPTSVGKGKCGSLAAFASDAHLSGVPVDIVELEKGHFT